MDYDEEKKLNKGELTVAIEIGGYNMGKLYKNESVPLTIMMVMLQ